MSEPPTNPQIIAVGLPRTGTRSLAEALAVLGYRTCHELARHWDTGAIHTGDYPQHAPFRLAAEQEAVTEPVYWRRLLESHVEARVILTVRPPDDWFRSIAAHYGQIYAGLDRATAISRRDAARYAAHMFGSPWPEKHLYVDRLISHNLFVRLWCEKNGRALLEFDVRSGWQPLCAFLDRPVPKQPFPWKNRYATR